MFSCHAIYDFQCVFVSTLIIYAQLSAFQFPELLRFSCRDAENIFICVYGQRRYIRIYNILQDAVLVLFLPQTHILQWATSATDGLKSNLLLVGAEPPAHVLSNRHTKLLDRRQLPWILIPKKTHRSLQHLSHLMIQTIPWSYPSGRPLRRARWSWLILVLRMVILRAMSDEMMTILQLLKEVDHLRSRHFVSCCMIDRKMWLTSFTKWSISKTSRLHLRFRMMDGWRNSPCRFHPPGLMRNWSSQKRWYANPSDSSWVISTLSKRPTGRNQCHSKQRRNGMGLSNMWGNTWTLKTWRTMGRAQCRNHGVLPLLTSGSMHRQRYEFVLILRSSIPTHCANCEPEYQKDGKTFEA